MEKIFMEVKQLYLQKKKYFEELYLITKSTNIKNSEDDAINYIEMIERREILIESIKNVDFKLLSDKLSKVMKSIDDDNEIKKIKQDIIKISKEIIEIDNILNKKATVIFETLKNKTKDYNNAKNLVSAYGVNFDENDGNYYE